MTTRFDSELLQHLEMLRDDIIEASRRAGQQASGRTYSETTATVERTGDIIEGAITAPGYFHTLIAGRGPGRVPANFTDIIEEWAAAKGLYFIDARDARRFANAVAWKIRREGSELYRNHLYVDLVDTPVKNFEAWLETALEQAMQILINEALSVPASSQHGYIL